MQLNHDQDCCDPQQLEAYLSASLDDTAAVQVEEHLSSCHACRERFDQVAFTQQEWQRTQSLLRADDLDVALLEFRAGSGQADRESCRDESAMLSREIQGWLDPTDDPAMLGRFAGYEIVGIIGHGGMGIVLKGFESSLNRYVAIKILAPRLATNGTARKRFAREARAAAAVLHENVIAIHRVDEWHGLPFLVMPYIAGVSLQKRIDDDGPLSIEATLRVGMQIAAGLAAAHAQGLVHRDIKPANILLDQGVERVTITDFGLARAADDASMTRTGVIAGTPQYMSPEQAEAKAMDARSDLFSLGSVLYTMAAGRSPFRGEGSFEVLKRIVNEPARPLCDIDPAVPKWFENLVGLLHAKSAEDRPQSAGDVQHLLNACLLHLTQPNHSLPRQLVSTVATKDGQRRWIIGGIGISALALILLAFFMQPPLKVDDRNGEQRADSGAVTDAQGKQIATVLGKPVYEGDINKNLGDKDNLAHLLFEPLMEQYCQQQGIDRDAELKAKIKDEPTRAVARMLVMRAELNRHLYEKYGGRVQLTAFGPVAVDAQRKWLDDRKEASDFSINDARFQEMFDKLWVKEPLNAIFASPDQIKEAFDPAITQRFIDNYSRIPAGAAKTADAIDRALAGLSESVHHDFARNGVPRDRFAVRGDDENEHTASKPDGLHVAHPGADGYSNTLVETLIRVHGNFDVIASFGNFTFRPGGNGSGAISLTVILENDFHTHASVQRGAMLDSLKPTWHFVQSEFVRSPQREPGVIWLGTTGEESTSGRLRLARIGETLYCLFAADNSPEFRLMHAEQVGPEDLLFGGIRLIAGVQSNDGTHGTTSVVWNDLTIRAERITDWPAEDSAEP